MAQKKSPDPTHTQKVAGLPGWAFNKVAARTKEMMEILDADSTSVPMEMLLLMRIDVGRRGRQFGDPLPGIKN